MVEVVPADPGGLSPSPVLKLKLSASESASRRAFKSVLQQYFIRGSHRNGAVTAVRPPIAAPPSGIVAARKTLPIIPLLDMRPVPVFTAAPVTPDIPATPPPPPPPAAAAMAVAVVPVPVPAVANTEPKGANNLSKPKICSRIIYLK